MAMAPTKEDRRAFSPFSSVDPAPRTDCVKLLGTLRVAGKGGGTVTTAGRGFPVRSGREAHHLPSLTHSVGRLICWSDCVEGERDSDDGVLARRSGPR